MTSETLHKLVECIIVKGQLLLKPPNWEKKNIYIYIYIFVGGKDLNFYVGSQTPITNKSTSEEEKRLGKPHSR